MNILLSISSHDGPSWVAFNTDSLNLGLPHHRDIFDAISFSLQELQKELSERIVSKKFGEEIEVMWGEITDVCYFFEEVIHGSGRFSDIESECYDIRYTDITIKPPFHIDEVITVKTYLY